MSIDIRFLHIYHYETTKLNTYHGEMRAMALKHRVKVRIAIGKIYICSFEKSAKPLYPGP